jgi:flagellar hook assembly protein FlgD
MEVYDLAGRRVRNLLEGVFPAGNHAATWDGLDERGRHVPAGVYFCRLRVGAETATQRVVIMP